MNRPVLSVLGAVLIPVFGCFAEPATQPSELPPPPAVVAPPLPPDGNFPPGEPGLPPAAANARPTALILPFAPVGPSDRDWIGKGVQQDLAAELIRTTRLRVATPSNVPPVSDPETALKIARDANSTFVIFGQFQVMETTVRITGQVMETATGQTVISLKATGPTRDLFNLEDTLADQVLSALRGRLLARDESATEPGARPYVNDGRAQTQGYSDTGSYYSPQTYVSPHSLYTSGYSSYPGSSYSYCDGYYAYPYSSYGYGYAPYYSWYPGFGFVIFNGHHHDHDRDDHGHDWDHGRNWDHGRDWNRDSGFDRGRVGTRDGRPLGGLRSITGGDRRIAPPSFGTPRIQGTNRAGGISSPRIVGGRSGGGMGHAGGGGGAHGGGGHR